MFRDGRRDKTRCWLVLSWWGQVVTLAARCCRGPGVRLARQARDCENCARALAARGRPAFRRSRDIEVQVNGRRWRYYGLTILTTHTLLNAEVLCWRFSDHHPCKSRLFHDARRTVMNKGPRFHMHRADRPLDSSGENLHAGF